MAELPNYFNIIEGANDPVIQIVEENGTGDQHLEYDENIIEIIDENEHTNEITVPEGERNKTFFVNQTHSMKSQEEKREMCSNESEGEETYKCHICLKLFDDKKDLENHLDFHIIFADNECCFCGKVFTFAKNLRRHETVVHYINAGEHYCISCGKLFRISSKLSAHMSKCTGNVLACYICSTKFETIEMLHVHLENGHNLRGYFCGFCAKSEPTEGELASHMELCALKQRVTVHTLDNKLKKRSFHELANTPGEEIERSNENIFEFEHRDSKKRKECSKAPKTKHLKESNTVSSKQHKQEEGSHVEGYGSYGDFLKSMMSFD